MKPLLIIICYLVFIPSLAQPQWIKISGVVTAESNGEPIEGVTIFIEGTQVFDITDANGSYNLKPKVSISNPIIIFSHIGYQRKVIPYSGRHQLDIALTPSVVQLAGVKVESKKDRFWKRKVKVFEKEFLGTSSNGKDCKIVNPWVLDFKETAGALSAQADVPIEIINESLGYQLYFLLDHFTLQGSVASYSGKVFFKSISNSQEVFKNREKSYLGSARHFFQALTKRELEKQGFEVYAAQQHPDGFLQGKQLFEEDLLMIDKITNKPIFFNEGFIKVVYTKEDVPYLYANNSTINLGTEHGRRIALDLEVDNQVSYLFSRKTAIEIGADGYPIKDKYLLTYGYWSWERVGDMVPTDYKITTESKLETLEDQLEQVETLNGFVLKDLLIPIGEIKRGGPSKDGIPAIDDPTFVNSENADFMEMEDLVIGVSLDGVSKAYPIKILNWHEIVNDVIKAQALVVTYCPLCRSGIVFNAEIADRQLEFGVSGLLYNSDVLLYDRQSESLWSQLMTKAVSGAMSGEELEIIPSDLVSWGEWLEMNPKTMVLSTNTGHLRDYSTSPYGLYEQTDALMFPVDQQDDRLSNKALVLGLKINGQSIAFPLSKLKENEPIYYEGLKIDFNKKNQTATVRDAEDKIYPSATLYWFAWFAFNPDSKVYDN